MRSIADWYARRGFVVICPDLFWRQERGVQLTDQTDAEWKRAFELYQGLDEAKAVDDAASAMAFLRGHPACNGKVGAVGFVSAESSPTCWRSAITPIAASGIMALASRGRSTRRPICATR